jgi:hypothetical protein
MPAPPAGFRNGYCITAPGDLQCPAGPYTTRTLVYRSVVDSRACSPCVCGTTATCPGRLREYNSALCVTSPGTLAADGTCQASQLGSNWNFGVEYDGDPPQIACAPSNSQPMGSAGPSDPLTVCCA